MGWPRSRGWLKQGRPTDSHGGEQAQDSGLDEREVRTCPHVLQVYKEHELTEHL